MVPAWSGDGISTVSFVRPFALHQPVLTRQPQLDNDWWDTTYELNDDICSIPSDNFLLPPALNSPTLFQGLGPLSLCLPADIAMPADSPSLFGPIDDDESMLMSPPVTPGSSIASPAPSFSPSPDEHKTLMESAKAKAKSSAGPKARRIGGGKAKPRPAGRKDSCPKDAGDPRIERARTCHNVVEKNYRNRLNSQFELMLATLDESRVRSGQSTVGGGDMDYERVRSKSAVLQLARERVLSLEMENESLRRELERLRGTPQHRFS